MLYGAFIGAEVLNRMNPVMFCRGYIQIICPSVCSSLILQIHVLSVVLALQHLANFSQIILPVAISKFIHMNMNQIS